MSQSHLEATKLFVQDILAGDSTGHDWPHIERVLGMSMILADSEEGQVDMSVVEMAALLHDVPDQKLTDDVEGRYAQIASFLSSLSSVSDDQAVHIVDIIRTMSWHTGQIPKSLEGKIVQDADRLDALGAIGIARCFAYGGKKGRPIFEPKDLMVYFQEKRDVCKASERSSIAHFYDKLFHIPDRMNTRKGKEIAKERVSFMRDYLDRFFQDWALYD